MTTSGPDHGGLSRPGAPQDSRYAQTFEDETGREWIERLREPGSKDVIERAYVIRVEAFDWNCPQHITPRYTEEQIREALVPLERRLEALERENEKLRDSMTLKGD